MRKFLFPVLVCAILCAGACSDDDNNGGGPDDSPTIDFGKLKITYEQRKNCPVAANLQSAVWRGTIYFVSPDGDFISYDPAKDTWKTLARVEARQYYTDDYSLFVWRDELYGYINRDFRIYRPETDTWSPTDAIVPFKDGGALYSIKDRLFYSFPDSFYGYVYLPDEKRWDKVDLNDFYQCFPVFCELGGSAYGISGYGEIYQFDPVAVTTTRKVSIVNQQSVARCAGVYKDKMLYRMCHYYNGPSSSTYYAGIYDPETNDYVSLENDYELDRIIGGGHWISVGGRIFVAPNNSKFYELKVVQ